MSHYNKQRRSVPKKGYEELREDGLTLIRNAVKARIVSEPLLDSYKSNMAEASDINWACYMMAQSIELFIKGLVGYYGEYFREGHFIGNNAKTLEEMSETYPELRELSDVFDNLSKRGNLSIILYRWSAISRYKDLRTTPEEIETAENALTDLHAFIRRHNILG